MTDMITQNLTEALSLLGIRHERSDIVGKHDWFKGDEHIGTFDAHDGWAKLKELTALVELERTADAALSATLSD